MIDISNFFSTADSFWATIPHFFPRRNQFDHLNCNLQSFQQTFIVCIILLINIYSSEKLLFQTSILLVLVSAHMCFITLYTGPEALSSWTGQGETKLRIINFKTTLFNTVQCTAVLDYTNSSSVFSVLQLGSTHEVGISKSSNKAKKD